MSDWESVSTPRGDFVGWGQQPGQFVQGKVLSFDPTGGTDANQQVCPEVVIELTEAAKSFVKQEWKDYAIGDVVTITAGQVTLKRDIVTANLIAGDEIRIELEEIKTTTKGNRAKIFSIKVRRSDGPRPNVTTVTAMPGSSTNFGGQQSFSNEGKSPF